MIPHRGWRRRRFARVSSPPMAAVTPPRRGSVTRSWYALLVALGVDNFGSGLFLPLALVYATRAVGLPLAVAATVVSVGTMAGLLVPPMAGRLVDRAGPRAVVILAQLVQASGVSAYLVADGVALTLVGAILVAAGLQLFYCALFALIADVSTEDPKDKPFALVDMIRSGCFGLGALAAAGVLGSLGTAGLRIVVGVDAVTFVACALLLMLAVRAPHTRQQPHEDTGERRLRVLRDRPFLALIGVTALLALASDFFLVGIPVYVLEQLDGPAWLPGVMLALLTVVLSVGGTAAVHATRRLARTTPLAASGALYAVWCVVSLAAVFVAPGWLPASLVGATLVQAAASLLFGTRANAIAEAAAPREARGRYLATFQYAFTVPQAVAPAVVGLFTVGTWVPWALVAAAACLAMIGLRCLAPRLPAHAVVVSGRGRAVRSR